MAKKLLKSCPFLLRVGMIMFKWRRANPEIRIIHEKPRLWELSFTLQTEQTFFNIDKTLLHYCDRTQDSDTIIFDASLWSCWVPPLNTCIVVYQDYMWVIGDGFRLWSIKTVITNSPMITYTACPPKILSTHMEM